MGGWGGCDENFSLRTLRLEQMPERWLSVENTCLLPGELNRPPASGSKKERFVSPTLKESLLSSVCSGSA